jgi:two-component system chemotaxis response regulator CheY
MAKVLVVDDSQMVRELVLDPLQQLGHDARGVDPASLESVLARLASFRPELVITDLQMPQCPGLDLVRAIRADPRLEATLILVFTAHRDVDLIQELTALGINGLLFKGLSILELIDTVTALLAA